MSLRAGGVSQPPWDSLNLGGSVRDDAAAVDENRARFARALGVRPAWLWLVHGTRVLHLTGAEGETAQPADGAWTAQRGLACTVQAADCMPVLFALQDGSAVAAAHAGWRGLAGGILEHTVQALCAGTGAAPSDVQAWLGPCIGPRQFEVGADVFQAFGQAPGSADAAKFVSRTRPDGTLRWLANLPRLAQDRLAAAGVRHVTVAARCTVEEPSSFFSFRRDGLTGRMAAAIWRA